MCKKSRRFLFVWFAAGLAALPALGQLEVGCKLSESRYLAFEEIPVTLEIVNQASRELVIGGEKAEAYLSFDIRNNRSESIARHPDQALEIIRIPARSTVTRKINLLKYYDLRKIGAYTLRARVEWKDKYYYSANGYFDVIQGDTLGSIISEYDPDGSFRTYTLETIQRDRMEMAFMRIEDENSCYGVFPLGTIIKLYKPVMIVDSVGKIHVLTHAGPSTFVQYILSGDGSILDRRVLATEDGMPDMTIDEVGEVHVGQEFDEE